MVFSDSLKTLFICLILLWFVSLPSSGQQLITPIQDMDRWTEAKAMLTSIENIWVNDEMDALINYCAENIQLKFIDGETQLFIKELTQLKQAFLQNTDLRLNPLSMTSSVLKAELHLFREGVPILDMMVLTLQYRINRYGRMTIYKIEYNKSSDILVKRN